MKTRTKVFGLIMAAVMLVTVSVFTTMAYLTDSKEVHNTFTVGNVQITLDETDVDDSTPSNSRDTSNTYTRMLPGSTYTKDPTVTVVAKSEKAYVRAFVTVTVADPVEFAKQFPNGITLEDVVEGLSNDWTYTTYSVDAAKGTYVYECCYKTEVPYSENDTTLPPLFTAVEIPDDWTNAQLAAINNLKIDIEAQAIQADNFADVDAAWKAFSK